jgi:hypothetical protein
MQPSATTELCSRLKFDRALRSILQVSFITLAMSTDFLQFDEGLCKIEFFAQHADHARLRRDAKQMLAASTRQVARTGYSGSVSLEKENASTFLLNVARHLIHQCSTSTAPPWSPAQWLWYTRRTPLFVKQYINSVNTRWHSTRQITDYITSKLVVDGYAQHDRPFDGALSVNQSSVNKLLLMTYLSMEISDLYARRRNVQKGANIKINSDSGDIELFHSPEHFAGIHLHNFRAQPRSMSIPMLSSWNAEEGPDPQSEFNLLLVHPGDTYALNIPSPNGEPEFPLSPKNLDWLHDQLIMNSIRHALPKSTAAAMVLAHSFWLHCLNYLFIQDYVQQFGYIYLNAANGMGVQYINKAVDNLEKLFPETAFPRSVSDIISFSNEDKHIRTDALVPFLWRFDEGTPMLDTLAMSLHISVSIVQPNNFTKNENFRGKNFERLVRREIQKSIYSNPIADKISEVILRIDGRDVTDIDAALVLNNILIILSCKAIRARSDYAFGEHNIWRNMDQKVSEALDNADELMSLFEKTPRGDNFDFSVFDSVEIVVCVPNLFYFSDARCIQPHDGPLPRVISVDELVNFLNTGTLIRFDWHRQ